MWLNRYYKEFLLYALLSMICFIALVEVEAFETFYVFSREHESWELDEVVLLVPVFAICLALFSLSRLYELRHRTRALQRSRRELAEANERFWELAKSREEFMALACHELNGPLSGVISSLQLMELAKNEAELREGLELATGATRNLRRLVDDVLTFSRITHEDRHVLAPYDIRAMLASMRELSELQTGRQDVVFEFSVHPDVPEQLVGDEGCLRIVLTNLVSNAFKNTDTGAVSIYCRLGPEVENELVISVSDTGRGIPKDDLELIFEPYRKASGAPTDMKSGLGLGLSIVRRLLYHLGGTVSVRSAVGEGSEFTVRLPISSI